MGGVDRGVDNIIVDDVPMVSGLPLLILGPAVLVVIIVTVVLVRRRSA
ncbi:MAG: hypothetical protein ACW985_14480 [Candidatus Thorarchaeota archaeon]|jgi:hypothetical protein